MKISALILCSFLSLNLLADVVPFNAKKGSEVLKVERIGQRVTFEVCKLNENLDMKDCVDALTETSEIQSYSLRNLEIARNVLRGTSRLVMLSTLITIGVPSALIAGSRAISTHQAVMALADSIIQDIDVVFYPQTDDAYEGHEGVNRSRIDQDRLDQADTIVLYDWAKFRSALAVALLEARN